jgi:hypothetical protein
MKLLPIALVCLAPVLTFFPTETVLAQNEGYFKQISEPIFIKKDSNGNDWYYVDFDELVEPL